jgi:ABC-type Fe3+ transport system permease subunit
MSRRSTLQGERWGSGTAAPFLWLVVFLLIGLPLGLVLVQAVIPGLFDLSGPDFMPSISALLAVALSPHLARGVVNTVLLGIVGAVISTALGTALALLLSLTVSAHDVSGPPSPGLSSRRPAISRASPGFS